MSKVLISQREARDIVVGETYLLSVEDADTVNEDSAGIVELGYLTVEEFYYVGDDVSSQVIYVEGTVKHIDSDSLFAMTIPASEPIWLFETVEGQE